MKAENKINIIIFSKDDTVNVKQVKNELSIFQKIVEGYIEIVPLAKHSLVLVCNENGAYINTVYQEKYRMYGAFFISKVDKQTYDFISLTQEDIKYIKENIFNLLSFVLRL